MLKPLNRNTVPAEKYPEKVLQFGTGAFLRGFVDYFIEQANSQGIFEGSAVVVSSTGSHRVESLNRQDGLYTLRTEGFRDGSTVEENMVIEAISRVLSAEDHWKQILACARNPEMNIVVSNTTEAGLVLEKEDIDAVPPRSFPGKLTAFLYERFKWLKKQDDPDPSMVILPCELVADNGIKLKQYVLEQAATNEIEKAFAEWVHNHITFCNTLVDRIVTGKPDNDKHERLEEELGYKDSMLTIAESYSLWAIEGPESLARQIPFAAANEAIRIEPDINNYRKRKVHILNGLHIMMVPAGILAGIKTVESAITHERIGEYLKVALYEEIIPFIDLPEEALKEFAREVLDRFHNPYLNHQLTAIALHAISKFKVRVLPVLLNYHEHHAALPKRLVFSLALLIRFYKGDWKGQPIPLNDDENIIAFFQEAWQHDDYEQVVQAILSNSNWWGQNLNTVPELTETTARYLSMIENKGVVGALQLL